jgi:hypothetical protein
MGVSKLVDLLQDEREVIRNDVNKISGENILVLFSLGSSTSSNPNSFQCKYSKNRGI